MFVCLMIGFEGEEKLTNCLYYVQYDFSILLDSHHSRSECMYLGQFSGWICAAPLSISLLYAGSYAEKES